MSSAAVLAGCLLAAAAALSVPRDGRRRLRRTSPGRLPVAPRRVRLSGRRRPPHAAVVGCVEVLVAELGAGRPAASALDAACASALPASAAVRIRACVALSGDVAGTLDRLAVELRTPGLAALAACWRLSTSSGGSLAASASRLLAGLRDEAETAREVDIALAGPRASARMLALLPVLGLLLGHALGAHPVEVLLTTRYGLACLVTGSVLDAVGVAWTNRMGRSVLRR